MLHTWLPSHCGCSPAAAAPRVHVWRAFPLLQLPDGRVVQIINSLFLLLLVNLFCLRLGNLTQAFKKYSLFLAPVLMEKENLSPVLEWKLSCPF